MKNEVIFVEDMPCLYAKVEHNGEFLQVNESEKTFKRTPKSQARQIPATPQSTYRQQTATIRLESFKSSAEPIKRLRVHSDGKVKTPLSVLAKAHQTYAFKAPERIISDATLFNLLTERINKQTKKWEYTQRILPIRNPARLLTVAPAVNADVMQRVGELFTAILLFKGKGYSDVRKDLALARQSGDKTVTYNVNTTITQGDLQFAVHRITVKKTTADGIFFCSKSCKPIKQAIQALQMIDSQTINNIE